ncbi:MAG: MFS transporter [Micrococcaceae bacterium]
MSEKQDSLIGSLFSYTGKLYFPITFIGRLPLAMIVVGVTTLIADYKNSYAQAGIVSAVAGISSAVSGPFIGKIADKYGQDKVLIPCAVLQSVLLVILVLVTANNGNIAVITFLAMAAGFFSPQVGALVRARWLHIFDGQKDVTPVKKHRLLNATLSYESMADETTFVLGPVLVGILATYFSTNSPLLIAAILTFIFVIAFAFHPTRKYAQKRETIVESATEVTIENVPPLTRATVIAPLAGMLCIGFFFGATLNSLSAFMGTFYNVSQTGIVYGAMGIGSATFAMAIAWLPQSFRYTERWLVFSAIMLIGSLPLALINHIVPLAIALFIMGVGLGPTMVTLFSIGSQEAHSSQISTVMTLFSSAIVIGQAVGAAIVGATAQQFGYSHAFMIVSATVIVLFTLSLIYKIKIATKK